MTAATARHKGQLIERIAESWLRRRGLKLLFRNYHCRSGELDLVMRAHDQLIIIEVKYRRHGALVSAAESLTPSKQKRLALTTMHLMQRNPQLSKLAVRFDLVAVTGSDNDRHVEWIRDAFRPAL